ncbi:hypothetical protein BC832DRAFT_561605 [Gaertneriomyces semiglobifer]|nr:hypothetical protein BC832DRAFT_561605 [Gaertneriomyces semiglobifer]
MSVCKCLRNPCRVELNRALRDVTCVLKRSCDAGSILKRRHLLLGSSPHIAGVVEENLP